MNRNIHFVGSIGLSDAETVFRTLAKRVGNKAKRYPDGETGKRHYWVLWQGEVFEQHPAFEYDSDRDALTDTANTTPQHRLVEGFDVESLEFPPIGYAREALQSYDTFCRLRGEGVIPDGTRFQVSLPTPVAVLMTFVIDAEISLVEAAYTRAMENELHAILAGIPARDLAIQWDVAHEVVAYEGAYPLPYEDILQGTCNRVTRLVDQVDSEIETGIHLCYGDPGHKHIIEPDDLGNCVKFANALQKGTSRQIDFFHMPVLRERDDSDYFEPLTNLEINGAELVLGLVHYTDGVAGSQRRIRAANEFADNYSIATECGFGRRDPGTIPDLLDFHAALAM